MSASEQPCDRAAGLCVLLVEDEMMYLERPILRWDDLRKLLAAVRRARQG